MDDIFVARIMTTDVFGVTPETLVEDAAAAMLEAEIGSVIVVDTENHLEGILTTTDFVQIVAERQPKDRTPVSTYMSTDVVTVSPQDTVSDVADLFVEHGFHHVPVVGEDAGVVGMISTSDMASYLSTDAIPREA